MARIVMINVDDETLRTAAEMLGTSTTSETVNRALADVVDRRARLDFLAELDRGALDLDDPDVLRDAVRPS